MGERGQYRGGWSEDQETKWAVGAPVGLMERLAWQVEYSRRYNHYFSLILVVCRPAGCRSACQRMRRQLRATDAVQERRRGAAADAGRASECQIGAILPETNAAGALTALSRLRVLLSDIADVRLGLAVYPDDGVDPGSVLQAALDSAAPSRRQPGVRA